MGGVDLTGIYRRCSSLSSTKMNEKSTFVAVHFNLMCIPLVVEAIRPKLSKRLV